MEFDYPLPERWKWVPLGELADTKGRAIVSGPFGSNISSKFFVEDGIPVIRGNNLTTGSQKFVDAGFVFVSPEKAKELGNVDAVRDDIIFTAAGSLGQVGIIPKRTRFPLYIISNKQMRVRLNRELVDPLFAFQWLSSSPMVEFIQRQNTGSSVPLINLSIVRRLPVPLPSLAEQKAIAAVLGALDDKIELNRRMNATLEEMARALFQSWFVDFDPVRAKLDNRQPTNLDPATAALFPASFQDSEAGPIPKGWEVRTLSDLTSLITKGTTPTQDDMAGAPESDTLINYVRVNSIDEDGSVLADKVTTIPESVHAGVLRRSILMANDVLYTIAGTIGRIALAEDWLLPANTNQAVAIIRPESNVPPGFLMLTMRHEAFREELHNNIVHAVQANLSLGMLSKARVIVPPQSVLPQLFAPIDTFLSRVNANRAQSRTLATLRDTLLPKLLSGELRVTNPQSFAASEAS